MSLRCFKFERSTLDHLQANDLRIKRKIGLRYAFGIVDEDGRGCAVVAAERTDDVKPGEYLARRCSTS